MQCCPKGSRQHCIRQNPVHCCPNTPRTTLYRSKPYAMLSEMLCNGVLVLLGQLCTGQNPENPGNVV